MSDSRYQQGQGQAAEADAPDFMQLAAGQLRLVIIGIDTRAGVIATQSGTKGTAEWDQEIRDARLAVADRLIALAQVQYAIPDEDYLQP